MRQHKMGTTLINYDQELNIEHLAIDALADLGVRLKFSKDAGQYVFEVPQAAANDFRALLYSNHATKEGGDEHR